MTEWFRTIRDAARRMVRGKIRATPFGESNRGEAFNASGVVRVAPGRFVFVDNHDDTALYEFDLDTEGGQRGPIRRRAFTGPVELGDPEGLTSVDADGAITLIVASSLSLGRRGPTDGLVRVRYTADGDLPAEPITGFRTWLLNHEPLLTVAGVREPDAGGLNIEGLAWDPRAGGLLLGLRGPAQPGRLAIVVVPVDAAHAPWTLAALQPPTIAHLAMPGRSGTPGIRDVTYDPSTGEFLLLLGRSTSWGDEPFRLAAWDGHSGDAMLLDVEFHRSTKPEGICRFDAERLLVVDDSGGYAVFDDPRQ